MNDFSLPNDMPADEMGEYLRLYIEETEEQLDALVQSLLALESDPGDARQLDEAFRLLHSIKGSSALLGLDRITSLTHHLESHFVRLRSGRRTLDAETMNIVLRCIDFLRTCNDHLRNGTPLGSAVDLLEQIKTLERSGDAVPPVRPSPAAERTAPAVTGDTEPDVAARRCQIVVHFAPGLPLVEVRAELVLARLATVGTVLGSNPARERLVEDAALTRLDVFLSSSATTSAIEAAANADGVERIVITPEDGSPASDADAALTQAVDTHPTPTGGAAPATTPQAACGGSASSADPQREAATPGGGSTMAETLRIDVDRLDVLLNLAGELVVNRARITQLLGVMGPLFRKSGVPGRLALVADALRGVIGSVESDQVIDGQGIAKVLASQLALLEQQGVAWTEGRRSFAELVTAVDQLSRVSKSLQHGVLQTRMVPVGPLFSRFRRSVRDIANELGKKVVLEVTGEKTELDKRMIDELGDPLNHLIRNSMDHGIEPADVRHRLGKPETATVRLAAAHRGNSVIITVEDDGGGIDVDRVRRAAVDRGLVTAEKAATLEQADVIDLIWEPGFSTKAAVSAVSGRGVGMDIVRTKVRQLNGSIEVTSVPGVGTTFSIHLPLTLTITRCMLFQVPQAVFAAPIENVREIVRLADHRTVTVNGRELCDIRGEFLPLVGIDDLFTWDGGPSAGRDPAAGGNVVVLRANNRSFGVKVDLLLGGHDIVVKPLDENYAHIRGLGGASILGDGAVCLLLDVATCVEMALPQKGTKATVAEAQRRLASGGPAAVS